MPEFLAHFELTNWEWGLVIACAMMVGMSKVGVQGVYNLVVPLMALIFGGKPSTGVLLPMLIMADVMAVSYYNRVAEWKYVFKLMPWSIAGLILGSFVGEWIPEESFQLLIAGVILFGIALMLFMEFRKIKTVPDYWWFAGLMGILSGFATMVGNAAGPIVVIYLLAMRLDKNAFIGTGAWFFLLINLTKIPTHLFVWDTISWNSLGLNFSMLPAIAIGAVAGIWIVKLFSDAWYRKFVIVVTVLSALLLLR